MNIKIGMLNESDVKIGIIASRFNEVVVSKLIDGAADALDRHGVDMESVDLVWVPGAFEIPVTAKKMA
ncbi:MAG: 6,7-dimethyl-8-ribityllumazine synthase, partial [Dialister micraerophilus]|nr:6,7-dimethyl-8-ribityllumazine synthase [Dialister micraerophilus]